MKRVCRAALILVLLGAPLQAAAERRGRSPSISDATRGMELREGLFRFWVDAAGGKVWLEVPAPGERGVAAELLYSEGLRTGLGSNPVGLDRGQLGETRWLALRRVGPRVLLEQLNPRYRADTNDPAERRAARESFATSVLWAQDAAAFDNDGRSLVDFTSFLLSDTHGIRRTLEATGQGRFALDAARSFVVAEQCLAFPDNVEFRPRQRRPRERSTTASPAGDTDR